MGYVRTCGKEGLKMDGKDELTLDQLLEEPVIRLYMSSFGVRDDDVRLVMHQAAARSKFRGETHAFHANPQEALSPGF